MVSFNALAAFLVLMTACHAASTSKGPKFCRHKISMDYHDCKPDDYITTFDGKTSQGINEICITEEIAIGPLKISVLKGVQEQVLNLSFGEDKTSFEFIKQDSKGNTITDSPSQVTSAYLLDRLGQPMSDQIFFDKGGRQDGKTFGATHVSEKGQVTDLRLDFCNKEKGN